MPEIQITKKVNDIVTGVVITNPSTFVEKPTDEFPFTRAEKNKLSLLTTGDTQDPYKVYAAAFTDNGADVPTINILENTIGDIVWTRNQLGRYYGTLAGAFPENKMIPLNGDVVAFVSGTYFQVIISRVSSDVIAIDQFATDGSGNVEQVGIFNGRLIEIRVYN